MAGHSGLEAYVPDCIAGRIRSPSRVRGLTAGGRRATVLVRNGRRNSGVSSSADPHPTVAVPGKEIQT